MTLGDEMEILCKLGGGVSAAARALTFRLCFKVSLFVDNLRQCLNFQRYFIVLLRLFINKYRYDIFMILLFIYFDFTRSCFLIPTNSIQY